MFGSPRFSAGPYGNAYDGIDQGAKECSETSRPRGRGVGGQLISPQTNITVKRSSIRAIVRDRDGVVIDCFCRDYGAAPPSATLNACSSVLRHSSKPSVTMRQRR